jgi:hypothetical protein
MLQALLKVILMKIVLGWEFDKTLTRQHWLIDGEAVIRPLEQSSHHYLQVVDWKNKACQGNTI